MYELFKGAYDLHVHSGPDIVPRKGDDPEFCQRYIDAGFRGYCIKNHYFCTSQRARIMNHYFPELNIIGAVCLNKTMGGLNALAVDTAGRDGAKLVWLPTLDAKNEIDFTFGEQCTYDTLPAWAQRMKELRDKGIVNNGIYILDDEGRLIPEIKDVMKAAADHDMIVCTGHLSKKEIFELAIKASDLGVKKLVVTHGTWASLGLSKKDQRELAELGCIIEQCSANIKPAYGITWDGMYDTLKYVGPENCILSSDCGNRNKPYPVESLQIFAENCIKNGFTEQDIRIMAVVNTTKLGEA